MSGSTLFSVLMTAGTISLVAVMILYKSECHGGMLDSFEIISSILIFK